MSGLITKGIHHITMVSSNAARTRRFYSELLGIGLVKRTVNFDDPGSYHLYFGDPTGTPGTLLTFFEWAGAARGRWGIGGVHHLALGVATEEAQLKWKRRLSDAGVGVSGPYNRGWFHSIYFADPDGQILEIATRGPGYDLDEPIDALGSEIKLPNAEQLRGNRDEAAIVSRTWPDPVAAITPDMALDGIHHITGFADDINLANDFYEQTLGLRLVKKSVNQDDPTTPHWFWANYDGKRVAPHSSLTMFEWKNVDRPARPGVGQTHHIAFRVENEEQLAEWREHLVSMGLHASPIMDRSYFRSVYYRTLDGLLLELATDGPGFLIDEPTATLGTELRLPAWLEPRRDEILSVLQPL